MTCAIAAASYRGRTDNATLAQASVFITTSPKSDSLGRAYGAALADVLGHGSLPVPSHLRSATGRQRRDTGDGAGYLYPHDFEGDDVAQQYLPDALVGRRYYVPNDQGHEATIAARMEARAQAREERPRRKQRTDPPTASMSDAIRPREEARRRIADEQRRDAKG